MFSPEMRLIASPRPTYAELMREARAMPPLSALRRPALVALVLGVSVALTATGRVTPALVLSTTATWSYVVLLQLAIALPLLAVSAPRAIGLARAVDLFFAGHAPWSLYALALALAGLVGLPSRWHSPPILALAALVPLLLTVRIVLAFFVEVCGLEARAARRMMVRHQALTWGVFVAVNWLQSAFTPRIVELWTR
jgi:hypothetical protein